MDTLFLCLDVALKLTHPIMPFITEELWMRLKGFKEGARAKSIMISQYPESEDFKIFLQNEETSKNKMECVREAVKVG